MSDVKAKLENMPVSLHKTYKLSRKQGQRKAAIKVFCAECVGYERKEVRDCTATACPLWPHRPYQRDDQRDEE
jgi:hypothetical protein